jgi:HD-GYP domain-containing protein (c-di-GMP phosphodiesterase class II)
MISPVTIQQPARNRAHPNDCSCSFLHLTESVCIGLIKQTLQVLALYDAELVRHMRRVGVLSKQVACTMGLEHIDALHVQWGALLHDVGKLRISRSILNKPGPLSIQERTRMQQHPGYGRALLAPLPLPAAVQEVTLLHHERWDGTGYPYRLGGEHIPLSARICAVVDSWDALRADRPYRVAWSHTYTLGYLRDQAGTAFDPQVVHAFMDVLRSRRTPTPGVYLPRHPVPEAVHTDVRSPAM